MKRIAGPYAEENSSLYKDTKEGPQQLTNFVATIDEELVYHDGTKITTVLKISGSLNQGSDKEARPLPQITVDAGAFTSGTWVAEKWGMGPILFPTPSNAQEVKTAIQLRSKAKRTDIYTHTGWTTINGKPHFLSMSGGINEEGIDRDITIQLPEELRRYELTDPLASTKDDYTQTMRLINSGPKEIMWTLMLSAIRSTIREADFAIHLAGRTGTYKSEISSLFQSMFGVQMDARHLPCSWNSTANALEALCHKTKNALVVVDDFVPQGTPYQIRTLQSKADHLIRAAGNQAGRARLSDASSMQNTYYPRGIILSTGEDIPEGHSIRGRMLILELSPGQISPDLLTKAQAARPAYSRFLSSFIHWIAKNPFLIETHKELARQERDSRLGLGHTRTPSIIGELIATAHLLKEYALMMQYYTEDVLANIFANSVTALEAVAKNQKTYLEEADPVSTFTETISQMLNTGAGHLRTRNGGIPDNAAAFGWTTDGTGDEYSSYKAAGAKLGWVDTRKQELYFDPAVLGLVKKASNGKLAVTEQTLIKRLKESGLITRTDSARDRNTVRMTLEGHPRTILILSLGDIVSAEEANE
jgi:hypothetical protein